jgi:serine/threonine-protein kinase
MAATPERRARFPRLTPASAGTEERQLPFDESAGNTAPPAFGPYRVLHQIGSGVLGPVFRTYEPQHDRLVAIKAFRLDIVPEQVARLADGLRRLVASGAKHPAVVPVLDAGLEGTTAYLAMEYIAAETLDVALRHLAPAPLDRALPILAPLGDAIDAAWAAGSSHGALHPRDVFVTLDGHDVRVTGFGIVSTLEAIGIKAPIRRAYAAPERVNGESWDIRSDVYSLGALAHELLTRRRPAGSGEQDGALTSDATPEQRVQIRRVLASVLADNPDHRFTSGRAFVDALAAVARGEIAIVPVVEESATSHAPAPRPIEELPPIRTPYHEFLPEARPAEPVPATVKLEPPAVVAPVTAEPVKIEPVRVELHRVEPARVEPVRAEAFTVEPVRAEAAADTRVAPAEMLQQPVPAAIAPTPVVPVPSKPAVTLPLEEKPITLAPPERWRPVVPAADIPMPPPVDRTSFPWSAVTAVGVAGIVLGIAIGYQYARRTPESASPASVTSVRSGDTDVVLPDNPPAASSGAASPAPPESSAPAAKSSVPPVAQIAETPGRLIVRSTPAGALLVVDGRRRGQTPFTVRDLTLGPHTVEVGRPGYVPHKESIVLSPRNAIRNLAIQLQPGDRSGAPASSAASKGLGSVFVDSRPQAARVVVDGRFVGVTPLRVPELKAGTHAVRLELAGHKLFATSVEVKPSEQARVTAALEENQAPN